MLELKRVLKAIAPEEKTELKSEKVELRGEEEAKRLRTIKSDANKWLGEVASELLNSENYAKRAGKALRNADMFLKSVEQDIKVVANVLSQYDMPNAPFVKEARKELSEMRKEFSSYESQVKMAIKAFN